MKCYIASLDECKKGDLIPAFFSHENEKKDFKFNELFIIDSRLAFNYLNPNYTLQEYPKVYTAKLIDKFNGILFEDKVEIIEEVEFSKNRLKEIIDDYYNCIYVLAFVSMNKNTNKELLNLLYEHPDRLVKATALKSPNADEEILLKGINSGNEIEVICAITNIHATERLIKKAYALNELDINIEIMLLKKTPEKIFRKIIREKKNQFLISLIMRNKYISERIIDEIRWNINPNFLKIYEVYKNTNLLEWFIVKKSKNKDWQYENI